MSDSTQKYKNPILKPVWSCGTNLVVVIDKTLVQRLGISEDNTIFQEEIVDSGILLKMVRKDQQT